MLSRQKKAFTLVELLIVMSVVAILVAMIIPSFRGMQQEAWITKAEKELLTLKTAVESYYRHKGTYPSDITTSLTTASPAIITKALEDPWQTPNPSAGSGQIVGVNTITGSTKTTYIYVSGTLAGFGDYYVLASMGPNGVFDSAANISSISSPTLTVLGDDVVESNLPIVKQ